MRWMVDSPHKLPEHLQESHQTKPLQLRIGLVPCEFPVTNAMGPFGFFAEALFAVRIILAVVPFEPDDFAVALEGQNMGCDPVEKPPVVAADDGAAGEILKPFF